MKEGKVYQSDDGHTLVRYVLDRNTKNPCRRCYFTGPACFMDVRKRGWSALSEDFAITSKGGIKCGAGHFVVVDPLEKEIRRVKE